MKGEVKHLANNERYRILIIEENTYMMDIEKSLWKIMFPFLFWLVPNPIHRLEDEDMVEQLQTEKMKRKDADSMTAGLGIVYIGGISLAPLIDYFDVAMTSLIKTLLMMFSIVLVGLLYLSVSHYRKRKLYNVLDLDGLPKSKLLIRPNSVGHFVNVLFTYLVFLGFSLVIFLGYIETENIMILIIASLMLFVFLLTNRKVVREGNLAVKSKVDKYIKKES